MKTINKLIILCFVTISILACSSDDDSSGDKNDEFDGSINSIESLIGEDAVNALVDLGFIINTGNNPPNIEETYYISPYFIENTTVPNDINQNISDLLATFSNQNNSNLTIEYSYINGPESGDGEGSFIAGDNNDFSIFLLANSTIGNTTAETVFAISGTKSNDGISNWQSAVLMIDDNGDPNNVFIPNNTGRLIIDSDLFSPVQ